MIDTKNFTYSDSRLKDIYLFLKEIKQKNVYMPGTKEGECMEPYIVVKSSGGFKHADFSSSISTYTILCYVPKNKYSELESYVEDIKNCMKELFPLFRFSGNETPSFYDDEIKAHTVSIDYINYKKL